MSLTVLGRKTGTALALFLGTGCAAVGVTQPSAPTASSYRVYDVAGQRFVAIGDVAEAAAAADVVFFGEFHDAEGAHQAQREFLELVRVGSRDVVLGFEMFERDVQPMIDHYLAGMIDEAAFLASSRPWPNYASDYKPLLETARAEGWPVLAANLPQTLATRVGREGLAALDALPPEQRRLAPATIACPADDYWDRFVEALTGEESEEAPAHATADWALRNIFQAQCARDAAMAEAISPHVSGESLVVHFNGAFHTDHYLGLTRRVAEAHPDAELLLISTVGVENLRRPDLEEYMEQADFLIVVQEDPEDS